MGMEIMYRSTSDVTAIPKLHQQAMFGLNIFRNQWHLFQKILMEADMQETESTMVVRGITQDHLLSTLCNPPDAKH